MSRDLSVCSSPDQIAQPTAPASVPTSVPSSSRASSSSSQRRTGLTNGSLVKVTDEVPPTTPSSRSSLPRSSSDVMPRTADGSADGSGTSTPDIDPQIIEALKSKDRLFVLKLGEQMETLIRENNSRSKVTVSPENQYQRLLVHRCAQYYKLQPENDPAPRDKSGARDMIVSIIPDSRIPLRRIFELVPAEQTNHPTFKIMRRSEQDRRRQKLTTSRPGSTAGEDGELSDPGPSESGSMGSRSTTSKMRLTLAEREAEYVKARSRIFESDEKDKANDTSASSSTLSLASASGSGSQSGGAGCGSSISDIDDNASTAPTESEWSVPGTDRRRGRDSGFSSADSTRSFPSYAQGVVSERASGTSSPAFTYPSLYEPSAPGHGYEQQGYGPPSGGYVSGPYPMYFPQQPPPHAQPPPAGAPPYVQQYQFYPQFAYGSPPPPPNNSGQPTPLTGPADAHPHHPHHPALIPYMAPPYGWIPPPNYQQQHPLPENHASPLSGQHQVQSPPLQGPSPVAYPYPPYVSPTGTIPYPGYPPYFQPPPPPPPQVQPPLVHPHSQPVYPAELPPLNGSGSDRGTPSGRSSGTGSPSPTLSRHTSTSGSGIGYPNQINGNVINKRGAPAARGMWSYGPGLSLHANIPGNGAQGSPGGGETVGPRLSSTIRRTSGTSSNSSGYRTPAEETASIASSSTSSSSSRRTFNITTPPKHPLPPRPDWAAGLKAQPTLHPPNRHRHDSNNSRTMSPAHPPAQLPNNHQYPVPQQRPPIHVQSNDFPPLSSVSIPQSEKRPPAAGAWANTGPGVRAVLSPNPGHSNQAHGNTYGTALFNHGSSNRLEDDERGFERPPPKNKPELFNPKAAEKRNPQLQPPSHPPPAQAGVQEEKHEPVEQEGEKLQLRGEIVASAILIDNMASLKIQDLHAGGEIENTPKAESLLSRPPHESKAETVDDGGGTGVSSTGGPEPNNP